MGKNSMCVSGMGKFWAKKTPVCPVFIFLVDLSRLRVCFSVSGKVAQLPSNE